MARTIRSQRTDAHREDPQFYRVHNHQTQKPVTTSPIGQPCTVRGVPCRVVVVSGPGTVDVVATDGSDRAWRVSGLPMMAANGQEGR